MSKKFRSESKPTAFKPTDDGPTTEHNYRDRFASYARAHGNEWHVIRSDRSPGPATPAQWLAWMEWFFRHDIPHRAAHAIGTATVPSEWPEEEFDAEAEASDRQAVFPQKPWISPARKADLARRMRELVVKLGNVSDPRRPDNPLPPAETPDQRLARMSAQYRAGAPASLSEAARAGAGLLGSEA